MSVIETKSVITRKDHTCWGCMRKFKPGERMEVVTCVDGGDIMRVYWCEDCQDFLGTLETWQTEDGFAEGDLLKYDEYRNKLRAEE